MRVNTRAVKVKVIEKECINNQRLAEYFAKKYFNERGMKNER